MLLQGQILIKPENSETLRQVQSMTATNRNDYFIIEQ